MQRTGHMSFNNIVPYALVLNSLFSFVDYFTSSLGCASIKPTVYTDYNALAHMYTIGEAVFFFNFSMVKDACRCAVLVGGNVTSGAAI